MPQKFTVSQIRSREVSIFESIFQTQIFSDLNSRPESENSSESSSQLVSPTAKPGLFPGLPNTSDDKDSSKNNILLAMLWLQRHREIMNMSTTSQQPSESKVRKFVTFPPFVSIDHFRSCWDWSITQFELISPLLQWYTEDFFSSLFKEGSRVAVSRIANFAKMARFELHRK